MAEPPTLHGSCACSRNQYTILVPPSPSTLHIYFSNSAANRHSQAAPLTAYLRTPLSTFHSTTHAHFPDETHASIRRTFHSALSSSSGLDQQDVKGLRRIFCGYCGTHLSVWREEEEWLDVTVGSLGEGSWGVLEGLGVLPRDDGNDEEEDEKHGEEAEDTAMEDPSDPRPTVTTTTVTSTMLSMQYRGLPYFESLVSNSRLGRLRRRTGGHASADGRTRVEWEVVELEGGGGEEDAVREADADGVESGRKRVKLGR